MKWPTPTCFRARIRPRLDGDYPGGAACGRPDSGRQLSLALRCRLPLMTNVQARPPVTAQARPRRRDAQSVSSYAGLIMTAPVLLALTVPRNLTLLPGPRPGMCVRP